VIYEMVTGSRPFQGATPMSAAIKRLSVAPTPPRKLKPGLSPVWESVILRCLERDPGKRFANAEDVARALAGERTTASRISAMPALNRRRTLIVLCALLIVGAGLRYEMKHWRGTSEKKAAIHTRRSVAVLGFKNLSGRAEEAWLSTALSYQLTTALAAGEQVRTVPGEVLDQMRVSLRLEDADGYGRDTLARIQRVVDADDVLVGSYLALGKETGGKVHLDLKLQNIGDGETAAAILEDGTEDQLPELVSRAGAALLKKLGVRELNPTQTDELKAFVSSNPEANRWYAEGLAKLRTDDAVAARDVLQKAIGADPSYAPAHSALALAWSQLGYDAESQDEAKKAFDRSASLSREQRLNIEARYYVAAHQWDKAADVYHTLFEFFPDNLEYGLDLAAAQLNGGKAKIAQDTVGALRALPPPSGNDPRIELVQAQAFEALGDLGSAKAAAARAAEEARLQGSRWIQGRAEVHLCFYLSNLGDFAPALTACEETEQIYAATDDRGGLAKALMNTGNLLADEGEFAKAKAKYEKAITNYQQIGNRIDLAWALNNLGTAVIELSDYSGARKVHQQALALFQETQQRRGQAASYYNLANVARSDGNLNEAASDLGQALAIQRELGDKRRVGLVVQNLAELDYLRGKLQDARENAQAAADTGRTLGSKQILADALTALGSVQNAEFQTKEAKSTWQAAESVYVELGQKRGRALCWTELARISIDEGSLPQAGELAQNAIDAYHSEKDDEHEAVAHLVLSQTRLAEGDVSGARRQLSQAAGLSRNNFARQTRWALIVGTARVRAATGAVSEALHALESVHNEMANLGYLTESMETRFVFDKIEMNAGRATARADLTRLEIDARAKGFLLIAHKAAEAKGGPHETRT
jgi:tetratricopeptide (TPR) repeat protein